MLTRHAGTRGRVVAVALGMVLAWSGVTELATAALVTFYFESKVDFVSPALSSRFSTSDKIVGSYSFQSDAPDLGTGLVDPGPFSYYALTQLSFTVGDNAYTAHFPTPDPLDGKIRVAAGPPDQFSFGLYLVDSDGNLSGPSVGLLGPVDFSLGLEGEHILSVQNNSLPLTPPSIANALNSGSPTHSILIGFGQNGFHDSFVSGDLTSLTLSPVPLPGAVLLFGSGMLGLAAFKRLRRTIQA